MLKKGKRMKSSDKTEQFKKTINLITKNKRNIVIISSIIFAIIIFGIMYAFFSDRVNSTPVITSGTVSVELQEDAPFDTDVGEDGAQTTIKTFRAISTGNVDCYVRVRIIPIIEYFDIDENAWVTANISTSDIELTKTAPDWIESNGYYYYKDIFMPGDITTDFTVEITNMNVPDNLKTEKIRTTIKVILESAQYDYKAWKEIFNISELPEGVEYWKSENKSKKNMMAWLDAARINGSDGDEIINWKDLSGNGNNAVKSRASGIQGPELEENSINGLSTVRFRDPEMGELKETGLDIANMKEYFTDNEAQVFIVFEAIEKGSGNYTLISNQLDTWECYRGGEDTGQWYGSVFRANRVPGISYMFPTHGKTIYEIKSSDLLYEVYLNDVLKYTGTPDFYVYNDKFEIGYQHSRSDKAYNGKIAEIIIYNKIISDEQRSNVYDYLTAKWGM